MTWLMFLVIPAAAIAALPGVSRSRRILACALVLLVPVAGPLLAFMVRRSRGGAIALEPVRPASPRRLSAADIRRLGEQPPVLERLLCGDPTERLAALVSLSSAGDAQAIAVLRWTIEHGPAYVVLDAALTLDELELRNALKTVSLTAPPALPDVRDVPEAAPRALPRRTNTTLIPVRDVAAAALLG